MGLRLDLVRFVMRWVGLGTVGLYGFNGVLGCVIGLIGLRWIGLGWV